MEVTVENLEDLKKKVVLELGQKVVNHYGQICNCIEQNKANRIN